MAALAGRYALRGADAVHLASVLSIGAVDILFAVWTSACGPAPS